MDDSQHCNNFPPLTSEQIRELATAVRDDFGPRLSKAIFIDHLLMLLEDVPGFEAGSITTSLIESVWVGYAGLSD